MIGVKNAMRFFFLANDLWQTVIYITWSENCSRKLFQVAKKVELLAIIT